jgi:hypothetical protein
MYVLSHAVQVNPPGVEPVLNQHQLWQGLEMKAVNALPFVPGMSKCDLVERSGNIIVRDVTFAGNSHRERITLHQPVQVHFERVGEPGFIENTISQSAQGLILSFTFALQFPGTADGSPEEQAAGDNMKHAYINAVGATLERVRKMVTDHEL